MHYYVDIKEEAKHFIEKLDKSLRTQVDTAIVHLKENPLAQGKPLGSFNSGLLFYEKRIFAGGGIRIYYTVLPGRIVIDVVEYCGRTDVWKVGNKKTQHRDIGEMKRK